jgi:hypothetical protein
VSIGTALLASVVLILAVYHRGFRKVALIASGIAAAIAALVYAGVLIYPRLKKQPKAEPAQNSIQRLIPDWNAFTNKYEIPPCPNIPLGSTLIGYCVLSGVVVEGFRPEMCLGTIANNGDCQTVGPPWVVGPAIQLCPYGLAMNAEGKCPAWDTADQRAAEQKLREFREGKR